jgi:hypothetical protein
MDKFKLKSKFSEIITKAKSQLHHIWINVLGNECKSNVTKVYWPHFHKLIYVAFKLPNMLLMYNKKPLMFLFL